MCVVPKQFRPLFSTLSCPRGTLYGHRRRAAQKTVYSGKPDQMQQTPKVHTVLQIHNFKTKSKQQQRENKIKPKKQAGAPIAELRHGKDTIPCRPSEQDNETKLREQIKNRKDARNEITISKSKSQDLNATGGGAMRPSSVERVRSIT